MNTEYRNIIKLTIPLFFIFAVIFSCGCVQSNGDENAVATPAPGGDMGPGPAAGPSFKEGYYGNNITEFITDELAKYPVGVLTENETAEIYYIAEEEKLGRDLYLMYFDVWGMKTFLNAAGSKQADTDIMQILMDRYDLENPVKEERGVFTDSALQDLYDGLVSSGSVSAGNALNNSVSLEERIVSDLDNAASATDKEDLRFVYENIRMGSEKNIMAFDLDMGDITPFLGPGPELPPKNQTDTNP